MGRCWTGTPGARVLLAFVSLLPVSLEEDLQQLCLDTSLQRLQAALWQTYEACEAKDAPAPFKSCLPLRVSDPVAVVAQAIVDSILDVLDADKVDIAKLQSVDCLEGLINALAASSRPLLHTSRGQWAAWASFTLASYGCWPLHGLGQAVPGQGGPGWRRRAASRTRFPRVSPQQRSGEGAASDALDRSQHRASRIISSCHLSNVAGTPSRVRDTDSGPFL